MDITAIAVGYGIASQHVDTLPGFTPAVKDAPTFDQPRLIEITQRRLPST